MTIGLVESTFLLVVNDDHESIIHRYEDTELQKFWGHEFNLGMDSAYVISYAPILHGYGDTKLQKFRGYEFDLLASHDIISHLII